MFSFELISLLIVYSIFYLLTFSLPREYLAEFKSSLFYVRGFLITSLLALMSYGVSIYALAFIDWSIVTYHNLALLSVYSLVHSIVTKFEVKLVKKFRLYLVSHIALYCVCILVFVANDVAPIYRQSFLFINIIAALYLGRRVVMNRGQNHFGDKVFAYSLLASIFALAMAIPMTLANPTYTMADSFQRLIQVMFISAVFVLFGFMVNVTYGLVRILKHNVNTDRLTGVYNRNYFYDVAAKMLSFSERREMDTSIIICDIDNFKGINDSFGHIAGDMVLVSFADLLKTQMREQDVVIRLGGEEFLVMLPGEDIDKAQMVAERIRREVEEQVITIGNYDFRYTLSLGVSRIDPKISVDENIANADSALYRAKRTGKNKVCLFEDENEQRSVA